MERRIVNPWTWQDQFGFVHGGERLGDFGLADAGLAFQQQRAPQQLHQRDRGRKLAVGDIAGSGQRLRDLLAVVHCQSVSPGRSNYYLSSLRGAKRRSNPFFLCAATWIASLRSQ